MNKFSMTCSCGHVFSVEAESRDEAVMKMKGMMDEAGVKAHMDEKHQGEPLMTVEKAHAEIEKGLMPA